jgi:hypothetical protein
MRQQANDVAIILGIISRSLFFFLPSYLLFFPVYSRFKLEGIIDIFYPKDLRMTEGVQNQVAQEP